MRRVLVGAGWNALNTAVGQGSNLARTLLVAALIGPAQMGQYAFALSIATAAIVLSEFGIRQQYIAHAPADPVERRKSLTSNWVANGLVRVSTATAVAVVALAGVAAGVFPMTVALVTVALVAAAALGALTNPALIEREREGDFRLSAIAEGGGQFAGLLVVVAAMWKVPHLSVWLLPLGQLAASCTQVAISYLVAPAPPFLRPSRGETLDLLVQGRPYLVIAVTTYLTYGLDKLVLGLLSTASQTGQYFVAQRIAEVPLALFAAIIGRGLLPRYSESWRTGAAALERDVRRVALFHAACFVALLGCALMALYGPPLIRIPAAWTEARPLIALLLVGTAVRSACHVLSPALIVRGYVGRDAVMKIQEAAVYVPVLFLLVWQFDAYGAALALIGIYAISWYRRYRQLKALH